MRFPLGLTARLYSQKFQGPFVNRTSPISCFSPLANHSGQILRAEQVTPDLEWHTPEACVDAANRAGARVVWLGTVEPLLHPNIGHAVAALLKSGRYVFLHTSGLGLRKRIHEFQPHSRLFLVVEAGEPDCAPPVLLGLGSTSHAFLEAIDAAGLSGFQRCAHVTANAQTNVSETTRLFDWLDTKGLEGFVVSSGNHARTAMDSAALKKVAEVQKAIRSRGWQGFSRLLENARLASVIPEAHAIRSVSVGTCQENA